MSQSPDFSVSIDNFEDIKVKVNDFEKTEWINKMISRLWPYIGKYLKTLLRKNIEFQIEQCLYDFLKPYKLSDTLKPFKFVEINLGKVPPRIGGVNLHSKSLENDEVVVDMIMIYEGDSSFKISLRNIVAGIKQFSMEAYLRVSFNPSCEGIPILGGLSFCFVKKPIFDFDLTELANALDLPIISEIFRHTIDKIIASYLVLPNRKTFPSLSDDDKKNLAYPLPQGVLRIHVISARNLEAKDYSLFGKSDPFCEIMVGSKIFKTQVINSTTEPKWDEYFETVIEHSQSQLVKISCYDSDALNANDSLGNASVEVNQIRQQNSSEFWTRLENAKSGEVLMKCRWLYLSNELSDAVQLNTLEESNVKTLSSAVLLVILESAKNVLADNDSILRVKLAVGSESYLSLTCPHYTVDPVWDENYYFMICDAKQQSLDISVLDMARGDKSVGSVSVPLNILLEAPDLITDQCFHLKSDNPSQKSTISLRLCLRVLTPHKPAETAHSSKASKSDKTNSPSKTMSSNLGKIQVTLRYSMQRNRLICVVHRCSSLIPCNNANLTNPVVRLYLLPDRSSCTKHKTQVQKGTLNPVFDETFDWSMSVTEVTSKSIEVGVKNSTGFMSKQRRNIGKTIISLATFDVTKTLTEWFDLVDPDVE